MKSKFLYTSTLVVLIFLSLYSSSNSPHVVSCYTNSELGFTITPPLGWTLSSTSTSELLIFSGVNEALMGIGIAQTTFPLSSFFSLWKNSVQNDANNTIISEDFGTSGGLDCRELFYISIQDGTELKTRSLVFVEGGKAFILLFSADLAVFSNYSTMFESSLKSFQITSNPPFPSPYNNEPTVNLPSGWVLNESVFYPNSESEHDPVGAGRLIYKNSKNDQIGIYYENNYGRYYSSSCLENETLVLFERDMPSQSIDSKGTTTFAGVFSGYTSGYNSTYNRIFKILMFVKGDYYFNVYATYTADDQTKNEIVSLINSISYPTPVIAPTPASTPSVAPTQTVSPIPTPTITPEPTVAPTTNITPSPTPEVTPSFIPTSNPTPIPTTTPELFATLTCQSESNSAKQGTSITITGILNIKNKNTGVCPIVITIIDPDLSERSINVNTDETGAYATQYSPNEPGQYKFHASWNSNSGLIVSSEQITVNVESSNSSETVPYIPLILAIMVSLVGGGFFLHQRKKAKAKVSISQTPATVGTEMQPPLLNNSVSTKKRFICKKCGKEKSKGKEYPFHYGKVIYDYKIPKGKEEERKAKYDIFGASSAWICRGCVTKRVILLASIFVGLGLLGLFYIVTALSAPIGSPIRIWKGWGIYGLAFLFSVPVLSIAGIIFGLYQFLNFKGNGEEIAIEASKKEIEKKFDFVIAFFTTSQYDLGLKGTPIGEFKNILPQTTVVEKEKDQ